MKFLFGLRFALPLVLLLALVVATKGHTVIQCYVCDNCAKIDKNTPLEQCGGENFTMTPVPSTSMAPSESTSTSTSTTSTEAPSTTPKTTELPKPPTVGPISSTTSLPTPPNLEEHAMAGHEGHDHLDHMEGHMNHSLPANFTTNSTLITPPALFVTPPSDEVSSTTTEVNTELPLDDIFFNETSPSAVLVRQRRHTEFNGITYHCYKIQKKYNETFGTKRGCIGVKAGQTVCAELDSANNNQTHKCSECTTTKCNGSSTIGVSIATLLIALIAVIYKA